MNDHANRITKAAQARKFIGQKVRWWPHAWGSALPANGTLQEVAGRNVLIDHDWKWLPDIYMEPLPQSVEGEG
jgi:hypothetical protein